MDDDTIQQRFAALVQREHQLRQALAEGSASEDADEAALRSVSTVEHYWR